MNTITVNGEGRAAVRPDVGHVLLGVRTSARSAQDALQDTTRLATELVATLKGFGIEDVDLVTRGISVFARYSSDGTVVAGFEASDEFTVTVRDVGRIGALIDAAAAAAGDAITLNGITFSIADPEPALTTARTAAIDNARVRAADYARAAGVTVGDIVSISEPTSSGGPVFRALATSGGLPIEAGSLELTATVTVVFEM